MPLEQMDGAQYTLRRMPLVALAIAGIVFIVLGGSFGAFLIPLRAVLCIAWMLIVTFGASVMVYQFGYLRFLGLSALAPSSGQVRVQRFYPSCIFHSPPATWYFAIYP